MEKIIQAIMMYVFRCAAKLVYKFAISQPYLFDKYMTKGLHSLMWFNFGFILLLIDYICAWAYFGEHMQSHRLLSELTGIFILSVFCIYKAENSSKNNR
jgi:hypothetical protein